MAQQLGNGFPRVAYCLSFLVKITNLLTFGSSKRAKAIFDQRIFNRLASMVTYSCDTYPLKLLYAHNVHFVVQVLNSDKPCCSILFLNKWFLAFFKIIRKYRYSPIKTKIIEICNIFYQPQKQNFGFSRTDISYILK